MNDNANPLIFISHDSRDAPIAKLFAKMITEIGCNMLDTFCASTQDTSRGIGSGDEWWNKINKKIDKASDVVCLLTQNSYDRPWILYEIGRASGIEAKVHGVRFGIKVEKIKHSPFSQLQTTNDSTEDLKNLILILLKRIKGAKMPDYLINNQIKEFKTKLKGTDLIFRHRLENILSQWETYYPYSVLQIQWKKKSHRFRYIESDMKENSPFVFDSNSQFNNMFGYPAEKKFSKEPDSLDCLTQERLIQRLTQNDNKQEEHLKFSDCVDQEAFGAFLKDQGQLMLQLAFNDDSIDTRAKKPLIFNDQHPNSNFRNKRCIPCLLGKRIVGDTTASHSTFLIVVWVPTRRNEKGILNGDI